MQPECTFFLLVENAAFEQQYVLFKPRHRQQRRESDEFAKNLMVERGGMDPMVIDEWEKFCRVYPNLLHPIFKLQRTLQACRKPYGSPREG